MKTQNDLLTPQNINGLIRWNMPLRHPREPMKLRRYDRKLLIGLARYGGMVMRWGGEIKPPIKNTTLLEQSGVGTANNNKLHANNTTTSGATQASPSGAGYRAAPIRMVRRTETQRGQLDTQITSVLRSDHPQSVRHVFCRMISKGAE